MEKTRQNQEERYKIYSLPVDKELSASQNNLIPFINYHIAAPTRCLDMLLRKHNGENYQSEVVMRKYGEVPTATLQKTVNESTILLITDGGLVPLGNPDGIPSVGAETYGIYSILDKKRLSKDAYEVCHQGYDPTYIMENPNRLLPIDVLRTLEQEGEIGKLHDKFISTTGVMAPITASKKMGDDIANYIIEHEIDAAIIVSTCGTSTRCGAYMALALQKQNIPVVQVANLIQIPESIGVKRIYRGTNIFSPFGDCDLSTIHEDKRRRVQIQEVIRILEE